MSNYPVKRTPTGSVRLLEGSQVQDADHVAVQGNKSGFQTVDAAGTPLVSPRTAATGANTVLVVPRSACSVLITPVTAPALVSEDPAFASSFFIPTNTTVSIDIGRQSTIYVRGSGASSTVYFAFQMVD